MARKVYITSEMSIDERLLKIAEIDQLAALIWPWILTAFDDWGRSEAKTIKLKAKIFPCNSIITADSIANALYLYNEHGLILLYEIDNRPYMAIPADKWFKYQTQIRKEKRSIDDSKYPAPLLARECAQTREESRENIPSPSTLPPFHPSPSINNSNSNAHEEIVSTSEEIDIPNAIAFANKSFGRFLSESECEQILDWVKQFTEKGSTEPEAVVTAGLQRCVDQAIFKVSYLKGIMIDWLNNGVVSLDHIATHEETFKAGREPKQTKNRSPGNKLPDRKTKPEKYENFYL